jgi:hypothetical protein
MNDLWDEVVKLSKQSSEAMPDSGQFASNRENQSFVESAAILEVLDWLRERRGWPQVVKIEQPDPPDAIVSLSDGKTIWCEFASITHQATMKALKHHYKAGDQTGLYQNWTLGIFQDRVRDIIASKEAKFTKHLTSGLVDKPLLLVLGSDGVMSNAELLEGMNISSEIFDVITVHLGYAPAASPSQDGKYLIHIIAE